MSELFDFELGSDLKKLAEDAAEMTGISSEEAFEYIIESIKRDAEWRMKAREVFERTLAMDFIEIQQNYADAVGIEFDVLTDQQKASALINHVLHEEALNERAE